MKYCIIGGGLTGLVAAEALSSVPSDTVVLYEKAPVPGGCLASVPARNGDPVETFYHHCFAGDTELFALMKDVGVFERLEWLSGSTGSYADGKVWPMTSPLDILRYPHLSLPDIIRLGLFTLRVKNTILMRWTRFLPPHLSGKPAGTQSMNLFCPAVNC